MNILVAHHKLSENFSVSLMHFMELKLTFLSFLDAYIANKVGFLKNLK